ncbi:MAG: hypothetical protein GC201_16055 [Alphaproteobacteria bacterium]|nr:hypothetical protein [Alphaproteobacteria bacterium]
MTDLTYKIIRHEGGWAYKVGDAISECYPSHDEAMGAAKAAAARQELPGENTVIEWEDERGRWHQETASGDDRPHTEVEDG